MVGCVGDTRPLRVSSFVEGRAAWKFNWSYPVDSVFAPSNGRLSWRRSSSLRYVLRHLFIMSLSFSLFLFVPFSCVLHIPTHQIHEARHGPRPSILKLQYIEPRPRVPRAPLLDEAETPRNASLPELNAVRSSPRPAFVDVWRSFSFTPAPWGLIHGASRTACC